MPTSSLLPARPIGSHAGAGPLLSVCVVLSLAIAIVMAVHPNTASLWTDEVFSRYYYDVLGPNFMLGKGLRLEPNPPTYFFLLHEWLKFFGDSPAALRSLSVCAYIASLPAVFLLSRELGDRAEALAATAFFAASPMGLYFAQETRVYAMIFAPACLTLLAMSAYLRDARLRWAVCYVAAGTVCLYLHASMVFLLVSCAVAGTGWCMMLGGARWSGTLRWGALNFAVVALALPYLIRLPGAAQVGSLAWVPPLSLPGTIAAVTAVTTGMIIPLPDLSAILAAVFLAALATSLVVHRPSPLAALVLVIVPGLFFAMIVLVSITRPIMLPRTLCWMIVPLCVLTGRQVLRPGQLRFFVLGAALLAFGSGVYAQELSPDMGKEPWQRVFADVGMRLKAADLVVLSPRFNPLILTYYAPSTGRVRLWNASLPPTIITAMADRLHIPDISRAEIVRAIAAGKTVWILSNAVDRGYLESIRSGQPARSDETWSCGRSVCIEAASWTAQTGLW